MQEEKHYINSIYYQLELTARYCKYLGAQLVDKIGISVSLDEVVTLDTLAMNGDMCQRDLAKIILKDRPSTGRILNSLEKKGFIIRVADTKNNRLIRKIILTDSGKQTLSLITSKIKEYLQKIPQVLSYERIDDLKKSMSEFREILKQEVELNI
jgi:DNA-binding MarR family transcriptional regulator